MVVFALRVSSVDRELPGRSRCRPSKEWAISVKRRHGIDAPEHFSCTPDSCRNRCGAEGVRSVPDSDLSMQQAVDDLFEHLICPRHQGRRVKPDCASRLQVGDELKPVHLFDGKVSRLCTLKDTIHKRAYTTPIGDAALRSASRGKLLSWLPTLAWKDRRLRSSPSSIVYRAEWQTETHQCRCLCSGQPPGADEPWRSSQLSAACQEGTHAPQQVPPYSIISSTRRPSARASATAAPRYRARTNELIAHAREHRNVGRRFSARN